jgi:hypothetical protein
MSATPNLGLPYIDAGQAQKHVTHNEALRSLDALVQLAVLDRDLTEPPVSPAEGERWIVKTGASGAWSGHAGHVAAWQDGAWQFCAPVVGWVAYVVDEEILVAWDGDSWNAVSAGEGGGGGDLSELQEVALLGIGTVADETNPVSARVNNVLWAAKTVAEGGDGTLRYTMSKESAEKNLSILLQDDFVGCAEIGLAGDDDFHFKVSPDGTNWLEAIKIDRASGKVYFPVSGGPREILTANRTYYVRTDGSDSNTGLANTAGGAFATLQKAYDTICKLDLGGFIATIQLGSGTYTSGLNAVVSPLGGNVAIVGNTGSPGSVIVSTSGASAIIANTPVNLSVSGFKVTTATAGQGLEALVAGANISIDGPMEFGACASSHLRAARNGNVVINSGYSITGAAAAHYQAAQAGSISGSNRTVTLSGSLSFSNAFASADTTGFINLFSFSFSGGTITGSRYSISLNAAINTFGGGANYFPGSVAGSAATGGQYA